MRRKSYGMLVVIMLLTVVTSSLDLPTLGFDMERFASASSETMSATTIPLLAVTGESVQISRYDGRCRFTIVMNISSSPLASLYRKALGFTHTQQIYNESIPENKAVRWDIGNLTAFSPDAELPTTLPGGIPTSIANESYTDLAPKSITAYHLDVENEAEQNINQPVRGQFLNAVAQEQLHSLGFTETNWIEGNCKVWGVDGACVVYLDAYASLQLVSLKEIIIGPRNWSASYDRAGFILTKIGFIQQMLKNSTATLLPPTEKYTYDSTSTMTFSFIEGNNQFVNWTELIGKNWTVDFGGGTHMRARILSASSTSVVLEETMRVTEENITKSEEELLEQGFLCYKVFNLKLLYPIIFQTSYGNKGAGGISDNWSWDWSIHLWDGSFSMQWPDINGFSGIQMNVTSSLNLKFFVGWKFKWLRLKWCKAWMEIDASLIVTIKIPVQYEHELWSKSLYNWTCTYTFFVGPFPVVVVLKFSPIATLSIGMSAGAYIICGVNATGRFRAGAGWKRGEGLDIIYDASMSVDYILPTPTFTDTVTAWIRGSVQFRLALLFYRLAGPFVEFEPYATVFVEYSDGDWDWWLDLGLNVNAGFTFTGVLKKILKISDFKWNIWGKVLWTTREIKNYDVMISNVRAPRPHAFVGEDVSVCVDVLNTGENTGNVNVTLYYRMNSGPWQPFADPQQNTQLPGNWTTYNFTRSTGGMEEGNYTILANATIVGTEAEDSTPDWFKLEVQSVATVNVTTDRQEVFQGQSVKIDVTVENNGTIPVSALPVFAYYGEPPNPISDIWCEYMRMVFDLLPGHSEVSTFRWDTSGVPYGSYKISANTTLLPYETNQNDNTYFDGNVTVIAAPQGYYVNIGIIDVTPYKTVVFKGFTVDLGVDVWNIGSHSETFDVKAYVNTTIIQTKVVSLSKLEARTVNFTWDTTSWPKGDYIMWATVTFLPGEIDTTDNTYTDGTVRVNMVGDLTGDGKVTITDIVIIALAFGSKPEGPNWNPNADINNDKKVTITDVVIAALHFGETDP